jgi:hypothetical protein
MQPQLRPLMQAPPPTGTTRKAPPPLARSPEAGDGAGVALDKNNFGAVGSGGVPATAPYPIATTSAATPTDNAIRVLPLFITTPNLSFTT